MVALDRAGGDHGLGFGFGAQSVAARTMLSTIAGSVITVAGLAFSITIVTLQLVSQQFTPRALRNFLADRINQAIAGVYVGVFLYCLLVLRTIRNPTRRDTGFVPSASITVATALAVAALVLLLVFIHHVATSIQVSTIARRTSASAVAQIGKLYPDPYVAPAGDAAEATLERWRRSGVPVTVAAGRPGYVLSVNLRGLARAVRAHPAHVTVAPGDFVTSRSPVAEIWGTNGDVPDLHRFVHLGDERDIEHDSAYGLRQLADIALKALSPGVNDPTTAITCIHHMQEILEQLATRAFPPPVWTDAEGNVTIVFRQRTFAAHVAHFDQVAESADDPRVVEALRVALDSATTLAEQAGAEDRAVTLRAAVSRLRV